MVLVDVKHRRGMTLLEVLVSMGILIAGLAGVAAILPAAGSRMAQATLIDRASYLAANARADVVTRRLASAALFSGVPAGNAIAFGEVITAPAITSTNTVPVDAASSSDLSLRIDVNSPSAFHLEDDLIFTTGVAGLPQNVFESATLRQFKRGVCYGAMLSPLPFGQPPQPGSAARMSIVVFQKASAEVRAVTLNRIASQSTVFKLPLSNSTPALSPLSERLANEANQRRLLRPCSWVLILPSGANPSPRWFQIGSSWTTTLVNPTSGQNEPLESFVSFASQEIADVPPAVGSLNAIGIEGVLAVDEQIVTLE